MSHRLLRLPALLLLCVPALAGDGPDPTALAGRAWLAGIAAVEGYQELSTGFDMGRPEGDPRRESVGANAVLAWQETLFGVVTPEGKLNAPHGYFRALGGALKKGQKVAAVVAPLDDGGFETVILPADAAGPLRAGLEKRRAADAQALAGPEEARRLEEAAGILALRLWSNEASGAGVAGSATVVTTTVAPSRPGEEPPGPPPDPVEEAARVLAAKGEPWLPALRRLAASARGDARAALDEAVLRLARKGNPREALDRWLAEFKDFDGKPFSPRTGMARLALIADGEVPAAFPDFAFYSLIFPAYPVARPAPEGLSGRNLLAVSKDGSVELLTAKDGLEGFFKKNLAAAKDEAALRRAVQAWLRLAQEFHQDGFYRFTIPAEQIRVERGEGGAKASGAAVADEGGGMGMGNRGRIRAVLTFSPAGGLAEVAEEASLEEGIRPICQSTKLLDPDPIVRRMAEKDLLVLGARARGYLEEQFREAEPAARAAIGRIWRSIVERDLRE